MAVLSRILALAALLPVALSASSAAPKAPHLEAYPKAPQSFHPGTPHAPRGRVCRVKSGTADAGPGILAAAKKCNHGGTVFLPPGDYMIGTALDLTFLEDVDFAIWGNVKFTQDLDYWAENSFSYTFQTAHLFWRFGGKNVNIYGNGKGVIDGTGQFWWTAMSKDKSVVRPHLLGTDGLHRGSISGLTMINPPNWFNLITNSTDILVTDMTLLVDQDPEVAKDAPAKNTDGWDTYRSSNIVIQNSRIVNTDDCVSFKPNSTAVIVQNLDCTGSHGISVGSLGQYQGEVDYVEDIYVYNITMRDATDVARIKVWPGVPPNTTGSTSGGGLGRVRNVTYETMHSFNNDLVISLSQCYYAKNQTMCNRYPGLLEIEDVIFRDFEGTTSSKNDPHIGSLICSDPDVCHDITATDIRVTPPSGKEGTFTCVNLGNSDLGINCVDA